ncbi:hypothetical protein DB32_005837 [Sandaracinus amylolyticus]|uniref:Uncharacterized protein n=1 Tax=Sandaracinus amylolyticus TaxID=927083 RepID=A0A0F6YJZ1_9BACT|nr:hypothetical protein DB32_005837 [Sandaracinus amylolyticus]
MRVAAKREPVAPRVEHQDVGAAPDHRDRPVRAGGGDDADDATSPAGPLPLERDGSARLGSRAWDPQQRQGWKRVAANDDDPVHPTATRYGSVGHAAR